MRSLTLFFARLVNFIFLELNYLVFFLVVQAYRMFPQVFSISPLCAVDNFIKCVGYQAWYYRDKVVYSHDTRSQCLA